MRAERLQSVVSQDSAWLLRQSQFQLLLQIVCKSEYPHTSRHRLTVTPVKENKEVEQAQNTEMSGTTASTDVSTNDINAEETDLTASLEAMLEGAAETTTQAETKIEEIPTVKYEPVQQVAETAQAVDITMSNTTAGPVTTLSPVLPHTADILAVAAAVDEPAGDSTMMDYIPPAPAPAGNDTQMADADANAAPEFEEDSDPYQSSSSDSSDDSSSEEDSDDEDAYQLLDPYEQARILMEEGGGSDDEGGKKGGSGGQLRTKNEVPEEVIPKPDVTITPDMKIEVLGDVEGIVENMVLIKGKTSGEYRVLESGSVLCLEDRSVIGVVSETLGRVEQPLYCVRFTNGEEVTKAGLSKGTTVYYSEQHSTYVFTQALKQYKGSDASNLHDEEVGDEEIEFSDDEAEMEHKRKIKQKKLERRGIKPGGRGDRAPHPLRQEQAYNPAFGISYDDEEDGPYKPLARPSGYASTVGQTEAPQEGVGHQGRRPSNATSERPSFGARGRGGGRGRGSDRGRGRGGADRGRGGFGHSAPPQPQHQYPPAPADAPKDPRKAPGYVAPPAAQYPAYPAYGQAPAPPAGQYQMPQYGAQQFMQYPPSPQGWVPPPPPPMAGQQGAYINPAFFAQMQQQMQAMHAQAGAGGQAWPPAPPVPQQYGGWQQPPQGQTTPPVPGQYGAPSPQQGQQPDQRAVQDAQEKLRLLKESMRQK